MEVHMQHQESQTESSTLFSFNLITVIRDVARRWYLIVAAALLVGTGMYVLSDVTYRPSYTTSTTFVATARGSSATVYQNLSATTNLAGVFTEVLNSSILRSTVLQELGMSSFDGVIQAAAVPETNLLTLQVSASDPRTAFLVTRSIIENHQIVSYQVLGDTILEVLQEPKVPVAPSNPHTALSDARRAAVLAAGAMCLLLALLSFLRDAVRSRQEAERKLDVRCLGEIGHERKYKTFVTLLRHRKTSILITNPTTSFHFVESIRKLRRQVEQQMGKDRKVLLVTSVLENEGKSTVAANLALSLAMKRQKVLLIDCDLRKPTCYKLLEQPHRASGTIDVIHGRCALMDAVSQEKISGLYLLLEHKALFSSTNLVGSEGMAQLIAQCREAFDFVIIDLPPMSAAPDTESVMEFVDASLLVVQQNAATAPQINSAAASLSGARSDLIGCVLNNVYASTLPVGGGSGYYGKYGKYGKYGTYGKYGGYGSAGASRQ